MLKAELSEKQQLLCDAAAVFNYQEKTAQKVQAEHMSTVRDLNEKVNNMNVIVAIFFSLK